MEIDQTLSRGMVAKSRSARRSYSRRASAGPAGVHVERGQRHAPRGHGRELVGELAHRVLDLAQAALAHAQPEELGAGEDRDGRVLQAPAQLDALVDELPRCRRAGRRSWPAARGAAGCRRGRAGRASRSRCGRAPRSPCRRPRCRRARAGGRSATSARGRRARRRRRRRPGRRAHGAQARPRSAVSGPLVAMWPWSRT